MRILSTDRLILRTMQLEDAAFYLALINAPSWIKHIGDKGIRTIDAAQQAIMTGSIGVQENKGFSLYLIERKTDAAPIGLCGLIKRDELDDIDIGYAVLPDYWGQGYAHEAATGVIRCAKSILGLSRLAAITSPDNLPSSGLLKKLGFTLNSIMPWTDGKEVKFYQRNL
jgi:RimJ/RimL family protein N-acetyltransferase